MGNVSERLYDLHLLLLDGIDCLEEGEYPRALTKFNNAANLVMNQELGSKEFRIWVDVLPAYASLLDSEYCRLGSVNGFVRRLLSEIVEKQEPYLGLFNVALRLYAFDYGKDDFGQWVCKPCSSLSPVEQLRERFFEGFSKDLCSEVPSDLREKICACMCDALETMQDLQPI
ncbi:MAG: hypothetical protein ACOC4Z_00535 [Patescibacteria group bacterium]